MINLNSNLMLFRFLIAYALPHDSMIQCFIASRSYEMLTSKVIANRIPNFDQFNFFPEITIQTRQIYILRTGLDFKPWRSRR